MKNSIIYLGIALATFTNVSTASNHYGDALIFKAHKGLDVKVNQPENVADAFKITTKWELPAIAEEAIFQPKNTKIVDNNRIEETIAEDNKIIESSFTYNTELLFIEKPIEEIIVEDNKIIESEINNEVRPIYLEKTIENDIEEGNRIIESDITIERQPLDFEKINKTSNASAKIHLNKFIGM